MTNNNFNQDLAVRLDAIIQTAIDGIITIDDQGTIETINHAAADLFGYEMDEVVGKKVNVLMPQPHRANHDDYLNRYQRTKQARIIGIGREVEGLKKDGTLFPFRLAVSEVILNNRIIYTGIIHDLTQVKRAEERLHQVNENLESQVEQRTQELEEVVNELLSSNRRLEQRESELKVSLEKEKELNELKSRFVSMASHEFRTPLSTIMSSASIIAKYQGGEEQGNREKHVDRIKSAVQNLTGILNDFLSLSKLEEGKVDLNKTVVNFEELCEDVRLDLSGILKPGQEIESLSIGASREIITDERVLKNILFNLMSNAIKYTGENGKIICSHSFEDDRFIVEVKDNGVGIPKEEQQHMFERFFRASNVENIQGTGLGLNIVKRYVDLLQGEISFDSEEGRGTTFTIKLPYLE